MDDVFEPLLEPNVQGLPKLKRLSRIWSPFSIPALVDKPQNPIIRTLQVEHNYDKFKPLRALPDELVIISGDIASEKLINKEHVDIWEKLWTGSGGEASAYKNQIVSWDTLRSTYRHPTTPSPFVTEQAPHIVAAARHRAQPRLLRLDEKLVYLSTSELLDCLNSTLIGCSSILHIWDPTSERFILALENGESLRIVLDGMDDTVSESYITRFIRFGTILRRLEVVVLHLRRTTRGTNSTVFGFSHALSSALIWVRNGVSSSLARIRACRSSRICDIWISLQEFEGVISVLASLCLRDVHLSPKSYEPIPHLPQKLLSHLYDNLLFYLERQAPRNVLAILSYILTAASRPYFQSVAQSVGLEGLEETLNKARRKAHKPRDDVTAALFGDEDDEVNDDMEFEFDNDGNEGGDADGFPSFMSEEFRDAIIRSRRSIRILSSPELDGGQLVGLPAFRKLEWVWTDKEVTALAFSPHFVEPMLNNPRLDDCAIDSSHIHLESENSVRKYKPELARLAVFDMEPGYLVSDNFLSSTSTHVQDLPSFIKTYPTCLPANAPTLPLLAAQVLQPVRAQAAALGQAALRIFLTPGSPLHLRAHLVFMRAYLLLAAPAFKARLSAALFSDADVDGDDAEENNMAITIRTRDRNSNWREVHGREDNAKQLDKHGRGQPWAVGLAFGLTDRAQWPPGGSDLSFYLRRVIMDSLEYVRAAETVFDVEDAHSTEELGTDEFWDEAESRLGFAIRDLPVGKGRDKWLDPTLIEALDFLYMDYKPPRPLRCLITSDILSKYQRVFAFLLRLLRVEHAVRLLYRLARPSSSCIFRDNPSAQNILTHFRFSAQSFVSGLSAYVADTAVRGNIDAFLARLSAAESVSLSSYSISESESDSNATTSAAHGPFADVYALMQRHSRVLDDVLAACLLRSAQRAVGDVLRTCLEVVLEFGVLIGNVHKGMVEEAPAAARLKVLYDKFHGKLKLLLKALRNISERDSKGFAMEGLSQFSDNKEGRLPSAPGGMEALSDLLLRLSDTGINKNM
ncbi:hypothetical protein EW145_g2175 [Phellinidium pouzarii]|uniref:Spindle pole body component n=1 Tax=Phellinidium pouzarii TaxID=167371 RepID=A0A4S4LCC9_9AGAM|nr:hypothetical protein EW145_g2175 [Phellinidium pouzarii]